MGLRDQTIRLRSRNVFLSVTPHVHPTATLSLAQLCFRWLPSFVCPLEATMNPFNEFQESYSIRIRFVPGFCPPTLTINQDPSARNADNSRCVMHEVLRTLRRQSGRHNMELEDGTMPILELPACKSGPTSSNPKPNGVPSHISFFRTAILSDLVRMDHDQVTMA